MPNKDLILLRFVTKGEKGTITYLVDIHIEQSPPVSRWKIESATKAYKGLHGEGNESGEPPDVQRRLPDGESVALMPCGFTRLGSGIVKSEEVRTSPQTATGRSAVQTRRTIEKASCE
jgi:hypothetical protein